MPFVKGQSGNPAGRPKGSGDIAKARQKLLEHSDEIIQRLMERVREGDPGALKLALERLIPVIKETPIDSVDLPPIVITGFEVVEDKQEVDEKRIEWV